MAKAVAFDIDARESLRTLLGEFGACVSTAGSAAEALAFLPRVNPDILIVDIGLPDEDGYSLLKRVRALPLREGGQIPAVALTGFTREQDRQMAASAGFQRHLAKPIKIEELLSTLKHLVEQQRGID